MWRDIGWAASLIKWMDVVTTDGELLHVSPTENADLLWYGLTALKLYSVSDMLSGPLSAPDTASSEWLYDSA